jgi:RecA-family ATPase
MNARVNLSLQQIAAALGGEVSGGQVLAPGPGHSPSDRSMSVKLNAEKGYVANSFAGNTWEECRDYIDVKIGAPKWEPGQSESADEIIARMKAKAGKSNDPPKGRIVATYDYTDADGTLLYQIVRYDPKDFRQRQPDGKGGWIWKSHSRQVLYRWPDLLKYPDATVFVCEGEKDADRLASLGHCAVSVDGRGKWSSECVEALRGRDIFVLEDNDEKGRKRADNAALALKGVAKSLRVVRLPDLGDGGDVSDWLDDDAARAETLVEICVAVPKYEAGKEEDAGKAGTSANNEAETRPKLAPLPWLNMSNWDNEPVPERKWAIRDRVPLNQVGLYSGEGGGGKSITELMKDVAHVAGKEWLGSLPEQGPAFYLGAEDEADEIHIRLAAIASHYGVTFKELVAGGLHVLPLLGEDATLCAANARTGKVEVTGLYKQIKEAAGDIKPKNISVDTLSRAFAGNEIDRVQVYAFAMHMQALAKVAGGSVTVLSHPSLQGINSGSGISGSTAWHGAFRFRHYLKGVKSEGSEEPDDDLRELEFKKNQYGPKGQSIILRYQRGLFLPEGSTSGLDRMAQQAKAEETFLTLIRRFADQGRNVSHKTNAPTYAPSSFAKEDAARKHPRISKADFEAAMSRLFNANKIYVETYRKDSKDRERLSVRQFGGAE